MTVWLPILMSMNRRKFFQRSAVVAALCTDGMLPSSLEAQSPTAPLSGSAEAAAVAAINPPAGVRVAGILMIPVVGGKYKVWTKRLGSGKTKVLLHGGPAVTHGYLEAMESFPARHATSMAGALWQMATPGPKMRALYRSEPQLAHAIVDVEPQLTHILEGLLTGYLAEKAKRK
jgi:Tetracyclin repressor-like, C-terminal domain